MYERELVAIVISIHKWWYYLLGWDLWCRLTRKSLKFLLQQRIVCKDLSKMDGETNGFRLWSTISTWIGEQGCRRLVSSVDRANVMALTIPRIIHLEDLDSEMVADERLRKIMAATQSDHSSKADYFMIEEQLYIKAGYSFLKILSLGHCYWWNFIMEPLGANQGSWKHINAWMQTYIGKDEAFIPRRLLL